MAPDGMLVVMAGLAGTGQPAAGYAAAAGTVLVLLAAAAPAATRAIARPLPEAARLAAAAGQCAAGRPRDVMASLSGPGGREHGRYGMAAARMRGRLQAGHAAEAAARRPAAGRAGQLEQACPQSRRPAAVVHGFTGCCRQQGTFPPAGLDRMLQRVSGDITRTETLAGRLRMRSAGESTGPDRGPGPIATDAAAHARLLGTRKPPASSDHVT